MSNPKSLYRIGRGDPPADGSHITAQKPLRRRSREEIDADLKAQRARVAEQERRSHDVARGPGNSWGSL